MHHVAQKDGIMPFETGVRTNQKHPRHPAVAYTTEILSMLATTYQPHGSHMTAAKVARPFQRCLLTAYGPTESCTPTLIDNSGQLCAQKDGNVPFEPDVRQLVATVYVHFEPMLQIHMS